MQEINWSLPPELYKYTVLLSLEDTVNGFTDHMVNTGTVYTNSQPWNFQHKIFNSLQNFQHFLILYQFLDVCRIQTYSQA